MSINRIDTSFSIEAGNEALQIYSSDNTASFSVFSVINSDEVFTIYSDGTVHASEILVPNGITIGTKTIGDYVESITNSTGVSLSSGLNSTLSIGQGVGTSDSPTFQNLETTQNLNVSGEILVNGTFTRIDSGIVLFDDNIITLNSNSASTPTEDAGIEIERGSLSNVLIKWDETLEKWQITNDGSSYFDIPEEKILDDLSDVVITSPVLGEVLYYDGSSWINETVSSPQAVSGSILAYVSSTPPSGWLICDGSEVSQITYADLYAEIGSTYNDGNESVGNFRLPNYINKLSYGNDTTAGSASLTSGDRSTPHSHTSALQTSNNPHLHSNFNISGSITAHTHPITSATGGDPAHTHPNPTGNAISSTGDSNHTHPTTNGYGENANHNHNAPNSPTNSSGTGGTHPARNNPPNSPRESGTASAAHSHPTGGGTAAAANNPHSHGGTSNPSTIAHGHNTSVNPSNTGSHTVSFDPTAHSHNFSVAPDELNSHNHTGTVGNEIGTHTHSVIGVPVYFIIKT